MKTNLAVIGGLLFGLTTTILAATPPDVGAPAPELALVATDGSAYSLTQESEGPRVIIFFRGSW